MNGGGAKTSKGVKMTIDPTRRSTRTRVSKPQGDRLAQLAEIQKEKERKAKLAEMKKNPEWWAAEQVKLVETCNRKMAELKAGYDAAVTAKTADETGDLFANMRMGGDGDGGNMNGGKRRLPPKRAKK